MAKSEQSRSRYVPPSAEVLGLAWGLGWRVAAGFLLGSWIDGKIGSAPLLTLVLSLGALAAGVRNMIKFLERRSAARRTE